MTRRWMVLSLCVLVACVSGCGSRKKIATTTPPKPTAAAPPAVARTQQTLPVNVPFYRVVRVQDSTSSFRKSRVIALKRTYDVLVADTTPEDGISKVIGDLQIRESAKDPNVDWMFFNIYDNELDVGSRPTRGTGVWAQLDGFGTSVSEQAAGSNDHSDNMLKVSARSYPRSIRYTNGDGYDLRANTITPFEDKLYSIAEDLYAQYASAQKTAQTASADLVVSDKLSREIGIPRSVVIAIHRKVKRLKASGVATSPTTETAGQ